MSIQKEFEELKSAFLKFEQALENLGSEESEESEAPIADTDTLVEKVKAISLDAMKQEKLTRVELKEMVNKYGQSITKIDAKDLELLIKDIEGAL